MTDDSLEATADDRAVPVAVADGVVAAARPIDEAEAIDARLRADDRDAWSRLYDMTRHLRDEATVESLVETTAAQLFRSLPRSTHVTLFLPEPDGSLRPAFMHQRAAAGVTSQPHTVSRTLLDRVVRERAALLIADASVALDGSESAAGASIHATLCVPLFARAHLAGVLEIDDRSELGTFSERDLELVTVFGEQLAVVLENTALRERLARAEARLRHENRALRASLETVLVAVSRPMAEVHRRIELAAREKMPLLIVGETGTGKEIVARTTHVVGVRRAAPFVAVNCAAIPHDLVESELFGHARGAFSGATATRLGMFREATGGTLFLDEVTELPLDVQPKLLRALEQGTVRPLGADHEVEVDVRIISASNRDPLAEVASGRFRSDLLYRLDVLRIDVPPLRERIEDIPVLADHLLARYRAAAGRDVPGIHRDALDRLLAHDWPGNVRELRNEIERAAAFTQPGHPIRASTLSVRLSTSAARPETGGDLSDLTTEPGRTELLREVVDAVERRFVFEALRRFDQNQTRAAEYLGLSRRGLKMKMDRFGLARGTGDEAADS